METFQADNTEENMRLHCAAHFSPELQRAEILDTGIATFVAEDESKLVGFAQLVLKRSAPGVSAAYPSELHRIYVASTWHGTGVAGRLLDSALKAARRAESDYIWLGVWERNPRAIAFYRKAGFTPLGEHEFVLGRDRQRDLIMGRELE